jgi:hypothetical protein
MSTFSTANANRPVLNDPIQNAVVTNSASVHFTNDNLVLYDVYSDYFRLNTTRSVGQKDYKSLDKLPYNTGKVAIGGAFIPRQLHTLTRDEELLQAALLGGRTSRQQDLDYFVTSIIYVLGFVALIVIWLTA